jgi:hypothetical protein
MLTITWQGTTERLASCHELDHRLSEIHERLKQETPALVTIERDQGDDSLSIGLGLDLSVLNYTGPNGDPPYYTSGGGDDVDLPIAFQYEGEWSEFPLRNAVAVTLARTAVAHYCQTGELTHEVRWEPV